MRNLQKSLFKSEKRRRKIRNLNHLNLPKTIRNQRIPIPTTPQRPLNPKRRIHP